jgi:spore maturation protein CgeB
MNKAHETLVGRLNYPTPALQHYAREAAALLRQQDEALRMAQGALEYVIARNYEFASTAEPIGNAIAKIKKVLHE